jgi:hypothetical protein
MLMMTGIENTDGGKKMTGHQKLKYKETSWGWVAF